MSRHPSMSITNTAELHNRSIEASFRWHLTPEPFAALAVEHLGLLDLACSAILAGIWLARVVATFPHTATVQAVTPTLLQIEHSVVDIQQADAAHQTWFHRCPFFYTEDEKKKNYILNDCKIQFVLFVFVYSFCSHPLILNTSVSCLPKMLLLNDKSPLFTLMK